MSKIIPFCALFLPYLAVVPALAAYYRSTPLLRRSLILRGIASLLTAALVGFVAGQTYSDIRPFVRLHVAPGAAHQVNSGFPLWQVLLPATIGLVLMPYWRLAAYATLAGVLVIAWANIAALLSSPVDVLGGLIVAAVAAVLARALVRRGEKKRHLYPQRQTGASLPPDSASPRDNDALFTSLERELNSPFVTITEFDTRTMVGYSDSFHQRN